MKTQILLAVLIILLIGVLLARYFRYLNNDGKLMITVGLHVIITLKYKFSYLDTCTVMSILSEFVNSLSTGLV